jgi:predicted acylesterase/phospholipase RssA
MCREAPAHLGWISIVLLASSAVAGCLRTSVLVQKFNDGVIETGAGDPAHSPEALRSETLKRLVEQELIDGYFGQGATQARVAQWLAREALTADAAAPNRAWYSQSVARWLCDHGKVAHVSCAKALEGASDAVEFTNISQAQFAQAALTRKVAGIAPLGPDASAPVCTAAHREDRVVEAIADTIRYRLALRRAVEVGARLVDEGQIPLSAVDRAAAAAFEAAADYLANRKWQRRLTQPTAALVVKGGASTGIFSAGAAWVALNIARECSRDPQCIALKKDLGISPTFEMMSGTSTGAMVSTAVDIYNVAACEKQRAERLQLFQRWFVCSPAKDLYCTVNGTVMDLLTGDQMSLLEFDGLRRLLAAGVEEKTLTNRSELLLNVVDFRTGRLEAFSDQDPSQLTKVEHVGSAAIASAALPVIVRPERHLPSEPDIKGSFAYLDGGIRSELPLAAAIRRGAERLFVISSAPSVMGEASERTNGFDVLVRYIDVSTGGVLESEIDWAPRLAESRRLAEYTECKIEYDSAPATFCPEGGCDPVALCSGDWRRVCTAPARSDGLEATRSAADLLSPIWQTTAIYRDERRVPGLPGYLFRRTDQRKLFLAGAEEARQRCFELAGLLGLPVAGVDWRRKLLSWCSPTPEPLETLCDGSPPDEGLRSCSQVLAPLPHPTAQCDPGEQ